jgi:hypothetical protein
MRPRSIYPRPNTALELTAKTLARFGRSSPPALDAKGVEERTRGAYCGEGVQFFHRLVKGKRR